MVKENSFNTFKKYQLKIIKRKRGRPIGSCRKPPKEVISARIESKLKIKLIKKYGSIQKWIDKIIEKEFH